jgi:hypothetical protein
MCPDMPSPIAARLYPKIDTRKRWRLVRKVGVKLFGLPRSRAAEKAALVGAHDVLENSNVVICEADIDDFHDINDTLVEAGFGLYDITALSRVQDGTLGWFYPVYINRNLDDLRPHSFWDAKDNDAVIGIQVERRKNILKSNSEILNRLRYGNQEVGRNEPCPCGSGRKFKHCCGSYRV